MHTMAIQIDLDSQNRMYRLEIELLEYREYGKMDENP